MIRAAFGSPVRAALTAAILFRLATGWLLSTRPSDLNVGDPGQWIDAGDRILRGEWPYRDWTGIYGPLLYLWGAFWYWFLGADWRAALQMLEIVSPVSCLILAAATAKLVLPTPRWQAGFILAIAILGLDAFYWSPGIRIWAPVAALAWAAHPPTGRWSWLPFAGCGLTPLLSPDTGLPCLLAGALLAIAATPSGRARRLAALSAPLGVALIGWHGMTTEWLSATRNLAAVASWVWGTPFPGELFPFRRATFLLPFLALGAAGVLLGWRFRHTPAPGRSRLLPDFALWVLAVGGLRSLLGRIDTAHLLFNLPPLLLLAFRFADRSPRIGRPALVLGLIPFLCFSAMEGPVRRSVDAWRSLRQPRVSLAGERIALPPEFADHLARVCNATRAVLPPDTPVLSLPVPLYAHLLRRAQALTLAVPELLATAPLRAQVAIEAVEAAAPGVVIIDPRLALSWDHYFLEPAGGPLGWSTPADEPITRELRSYISKWYVQRAEVDGARIFLRRASPLLQRRVRIVATLTPVQGSSDEIARGNIVSILAGGAVCDEIRTFVALHYAPGLAGLAKSYTRLTVVDGKGGTREMIQPLPPAHGQRQLHWPVPRVPIDRIIIDAGTPGTFNPDPLSAIIAPVHLIRYAD